MNFLYFDITNDKKTKRRNTYSLNPDDSRE